MTDAEINNLNLSKSDKEQLVDYAFSIDEGKKAILKYIYASQSRYIINFMDQNKIDYCYVHFTFSDGKVNPTFLIDKDKDSNKSMFCAKFTRSPNF